MLFVKHAKDGCRECCARQVVPFASLPSLALACFVEILAAAVSAEPALATDRCAALPCGDGMVATCAMGVAEGTPEGRTGYSCVRFPSDIQSQAAPSLPMRGFAKTACDKAKVSMREVLPCMARTFTEQCCKVTFQSILGEKKLEDLECFESAKSRFESRPLGLVLLAPYDVPYDLLLGQVAADTCSKSPLGTASSGTFLGCGTAR